MSLIGQTIGNIRIDSLIGKGGMGAVYMGYDVVLKRELAVKAISKDYALAPDAQARFLREARIMSRLDHPNICRIFDYVETDENDLLILELIGGKSLRHIPMIGFRYADKLRMADQMIAAVAAAHAEGVVHRDLKPDNVMLTDKGAIKVLDFGLGRFQDEHGLRNSLPGQGKGRDEVPPEDDTEEFKADFFENETIAGGQHDSDASIDTQSDHIDTGTVAGSLMGTLGYMSPEAARGESATSSSDVFTMGLIFQEIFTGKPAYPRNKPFARRLRLAAAGDTLPFEGLESDLTELIKRMLSLEPAARPSAEDVRKQLQWIMDAPKRKRKKAVVTGIVAASLIFGLIMGWQAWRINQAVALARMEADRANRESLAAQEVSDFMEGLFSIANPDQARGSVVTARQLLDAGAAKIDRELKDQPLTRARLMRTMGQSYRGLGLLQESLKLQEEALALRRANLPPDHALTASSMSLVAELYRKLDQYDEAAVLIEEAIAVIRKQDPARPQKLADFLSIKANVTWSQGNYEPAIASAEESLNLRMMDGVRPNARARALSLLGSLYDEVGRTNEAEQLMLKAQMIWETHDPSDPEMIKLLNNLGTIYFIWNQFPKARPYFERAIEMSRTLEGEGHMNQGFMHTNLGSIAEEEGQPEQAIAHYLTALEIFTKTLGPDHSMTGLVHDNLGATYTRQKNDGPAMENLEKSLAIIERLYGTDHPELVYTLLGIAHAHYIFDRPNQGDVVLARARAIAPWDQLSDPAAHANKFIFLADAMYLKKAPRKAVDVYDTALLLLEKAQVPGSKFVSDAMAQYIKALGELGREADAERVKHRLEALGQGQTQTEETGLNL